VGALIARGTPSTNSRISQTVGDDELVELGPHTPKACLTDEDIQRMERHHELNDETHRTWVRDAKGNSKIK
jgi:hypothetical protein